MQQTLHECMFIVYGSIKYILEVADENWCWFERKAVSSAPFVANCFVCLQAKSQNLMHTIFRCVIKSRNDKQFHEKMWYTAWRWSSCYYFLLMCVCYWKCRLWEEKGGWGGGWGGGGEQEGQKREKLRERKRGERDRMKVMNICLINVCMVSFFEISCTNYQCIGLKDTKRENS